MELLSAALRTYPWGSRSLIQKLRGTEEGRPEAELWFGAHPASPSTVNHRGLDDIISDHPEAALGRRLADQFGQLPFLMKILAADEPLSLQAHPSLEQAREGFHRENVAGLNLSAPDRNYRDANHKPELIVALTDFVAMAGFRPLNETIELITALNSEELNRWLGMLTPEEEAESLRALFTTWITVPPNTRQALIDAVITSAREYLSRDEQEPWITFTLQSILQVHDYYPGDVGVLGALLLNFFLLRPGEAIYLNAGNLHAYIRGMGVEIMANSDNVLRGGLTSKYVDVPELVRVLDFEPLRDAHVHAVDGDLGVDYPVPASEFTLTRIDVDDSRVEFSHDGPSVLVCTEGEATVTCGEKMETITPGAAVWVPASDGEVTISGPAQVFLARA